MSVDEFEEIRFELGPPGRPFPLAWLADALGYSERQVSRWLSPQEPAPIPLSAAKLMRLFLHLGRVM